MATRSRTMIRERLTSSSADVLANTLLANAGPGLYTIWAVSSVATATISISSPNQQIASSENVQQSGEEGIKVNENTPWVIEIPEGGGVQPTIAIGGTTGNVIVQVLHRPTFKRARH